MDMNQIRNFLLSGVDEYDGVELPYKEMLNTECDPIQNRLDNVYQDTAEREQAHSELSQALTAYQIVYMELGMKAGARLIHQLLLSDDRPAV
jgi:phage-related protein